MEAANLADIRNRTTNYINDTVAIILMNLQENYDQLMPHELLERENIVKKTIYNPHDLIATVFSVVKELLEFTNITRTSYTQFQAINIAYVILHRMGKFGLEICKCNRIPEVQKTWVRFKQFFWTSHRDLIETSDITVEEAGIYHANVVCDVVSGLQEALQQEQNQTETPTSVQAPVDHVSNAVQITQQQLATQLQKI